MVSTAPRVSVWGILHLGDEPQPSQKGFFQLLWLSSRGEIPAGMSRSWVQAPILQDQAGCALWGFALHLLPLRSQNPSLILHPPELLSTLGDHCQGIWGHLPGTATPPNPHAHQRGCVCVWAGVHASIPYPPLQLFGWEPPQKAGAAG